MTNVVDTQDSYTEAFADFDGCAAGGHPPWLRSVRRSAMARFLELGLPTTRDEDWRFTNVDRIPPATFTHAARSGTDITPSDLDRLDLPAFECTRLVFVNNRYEPRLSRLGRLPTGVVVTTLASELATTGPGRLDESLGRYADHHHDAFCALNTAFIEDGAVVRIPPETVLRDPIHLVYVAVPGSGATIMHPRNLIFVGDGSEANVVEDYVSLNEDSHFSNVVTELVVGENSRTGHYRVNRENDSAFHMSTLAIHQGRMSEVACHSLLLGGALVRNTIHPVLAGDGGHCLLNGLFMGSGQQHLDNYLKVEHAAPRCTSRQFFNGILAERSRGVFHGRIIVHKDAQKTDAKQSNRNVLISEAAQINTKPQLEIYADDVKCTHGATIGQIDDDSIYYLRSRGIPEESAHAMLLTAFAGECLQRIEHEPLREYFGTIVEQWLPRATRAQRRTP